MTTPPPIEIVPVAADPAALALLPLLRDRLEALLHTPVAVTPPFDLTLPATNDSEQLSSNRIVDALIERSGPDLDPETRWVLAITARDLNAPGRSFVFGEATLGGAWALVSTARIRSAAPPPLVLERLLKESVHELGHLRGLLHCSAPRCVMNPSRTPGDVDMKDSEFCNRCSHRFLRLPSP